MKLERFDDPHGMRPLIAQCIERYGFAPEHSYGCFVHSTEKGWRSVFFRSDEGYGIFSYVSDDGTEWEVLGEPLAPTPARDEVLGAFLEYVFLLPETGKVYLETDLETRKRILKTLKTGLQASRITEHLVWPVLAMDTYDLSLAGARMKPMRNVRNRFLREHTLEAVAPASVPVKDLHDVVRRWGKDRPATHHAYSAEYHALVDDGFTGTRGARVLMVDGAPHAISAGWPIPHSDGYYHSLALHTYAYWGLGEMLMLESLGWIRKEGYGFANLGGSDAGLLAFKKKFGDVSTYATCYFSIKRVS